MRTASDPAGPLTSSFRDPSGHVFVRDGRVLRQVNRSYALQYERLLSSGLYDALAAAGLLIPHRELPPEPAADVYRVLEPERIPFISYPFEWAFAQLKAAALTTLDVQKRAVDHGMVLKDASAYNIQFRGAAPVLIDTLSFDIWEEGTPWAAYRQFCQHFLGPLALMSRADVRLGALSRVFIDGVPLDLVADLLPFSSKLAPSLLVHVHLHARAQRRHGSGTLDRQARRRFTRTAMLGLVEHLESAVQALTYGARGTAWVEYYDQTNYTAAAMAEKRTPGRSLREARCSRPRSGTWARIPACSAASRLPPARTPWPATAIRRPSSATISIAGRATSRVCCRSSSTWPIPAAPWAGITKSASRCSIAVPPIW